MATGTIRMSSQTNIIILLVVLLLSTNSVQSSRAHEEFSRSIRSATDPVNENQLEIHKDHDNSNIRKKYKTSGATSTSMQDTKSITIDSFPDEIFIKIFFYLKFSYIRQVLSRVGKRWNELAYSEILYPTDLKLVYDIHIPATAKKYKKRELIHNPTQAINFNAFQTLEIEICGDMISYEDLFNLVQDRTEKFEKMENLIIKMDWTSSNDKTLNLLTQLLRKSKVLKAFSLKWIDTQKRYKHVEFTTDDFQQKLNFWKELKNSKAKDITFEINDEYYDDSRAEKALLNILANELRFYSYLFENSESMELTNLRKLEFNVPPSEKTYQFLKNFIKKSCHTLEEINVDFYYFVHWMKKKENLLEIISNCQNLRKLIINFPIINDWKYKWNEETGRDFEPHVWQKVVDLVGNRRTDIFLELRMNVGFVSLYKFFKIPNNESRLKNWKALKSLIVSVRDPDEYVDSFSKICFILNEMAGIFAKSPELENLEITYDISGDEYEWMDIINKLNFANKLKNLKEFAIAYRLPEARIDNTRLMNLVQMLKNINKITVTVTSSEFLENCAYVNDRKESYFGPDISDEELAEQKNAIYSIFRDSFVGEYILNEFDKEKLRNSLHYLFEIDSKFHTRFRKNDSHRLILTRKYK